MNDIKNVVTDGFSLGETSLALLSLKLALKAYFSTYKNMKYGLHILTSKFSETNEIDQETIDHNHSSAYIENCYEAIVHFHHFVELVCKNLLRNEHPLLADFTSSRHHIILYKLISGEDLTEDDRSKLKSIEFSESLERLTALVKEKKIQNYEQWNFFKSASDWLTHLNILRNRLLHRGIFSLRYPALDIFFGLYALPFLRNVVMTEKYSGKEKFWKYYPIRCEIDPIEQIVEEFRTNGYEYNLGKVAFLKELARAAYEQPIWINYKAKEIGGNQYRPFIMDTEHKLRAERMAQSEIANVADVRDCPVCGVSSLVVYDDIESEGEDNIEGTYDKAWRYTFQVVCMCCSFEVNHHLKNPKEYGIPIDDYWYGEELE